MTANDSIIRDLCATFADGYGTPGCSGSFTAVPNEAFSYAERIAYRDEDGVVHVTKKQFSVTTSRHTQEVRRALSRAGYVTDGEDDTDGWELWKPRR